MIVKNKYCFSRKKFYLFLIIIIVGFIFLQSKYLKNNQIASIPRASQLFIIGGTEVKQGEFPFMVFLDISKVSQKFSKGNLITTTNSYLCGGVLIKPQWILTAAHCFITDQGSIGSVDAYVGVVNVPNFDSQAEVEKNENRHPIKNVFIQPSFTSTLNEFNIYDDDIALLKLDKEINDIKLPSVNTDEGLYDPMFLKDRTHVYQSPRFTTILGYGTIAISPTPGITVDPKALNADFILPDRLQKISLPIDSAHPKYGEKYFTVGYSGNKAYVKTPSLGDSGGPILYKSFIGSYTLLGIVTDSGAGLTSYPSLGLKITKYIDWIKEVTDNY